MDFDGRADDLSAQLVRALEFRVHLEWKRILQKVAKAAKVDCVWAVVWLEGI